MFRSILACSLAPVSCHSIAGSGMPVHLILIASLSGREASSFERVCRVHICSLSFQNCQIFSWVSRENRVSPRCRKIPHVDALALSKSSFPVHHLSISPYIDSPITCTKTNAGSTTHRSRNEIPNNATCTQRPESLIRIIPFFNTNSKYNPLKESHL